MGSALYNSFITTDFSEAQLEFITPPYSKNKETISFLNDIHKFVSANIVEESLWPLSFPPYIANEDQIIIANYGSSNKALFKTLYRKGLAYRYGRLMQSISGIHFNFSFANELWDSELFTDSSVQTKDLRSLIYFRMIRNLERLNWLILYLFGASPIVPSSFLKDHDKDFIIKDNECFSQYATSLRMSNLGYQNMKQAGIHVSNSSLTEYIEDLRKLTEMPADQFNDGLGNTNNKALQINSNILQIEAEYYAPYRPKAIRDSEKRLTSNLLSNGVDYVEIRSIDINPFSRVGIDLDEMDLLELLLIFCAFSESPMSHNDEIKINRENSILVSREGRRPDLKINQPNKKIFMKDYALEILDRIEPIASCLGKERLLLDAKAKVIDPDLTLSGRFLSRYMEEGIALDDLGLELSNENKKYFLKNNLSKERNNFFIQEALRSISLQNEEEKNDKGSFQSYIEEYFNS